MRPRRITAQGKVLPPPEVVQGAMLAIQQVIVDNGFTPDETFNGDESGMNHCAPPRLQYVPLSAERAIAPEADDKARFTAFLYGSAAGKMQPIMFIVKCTSSSSVDLSRTTVLTKLHSSTFSAASGWAARMWQREMQVQSKDKKGVINVIHRRPYLIHLLEGHVITCQNRAWMDTAGIAMWTDLIFGPRTKEATGRACMVWDNCGPHKVEAVRKVFQEWNVTVLELPPKMTDTLQVMDLVVNSPLKAAIRRQRCRDLFKYFQEWKINRLQAVVSKVPLPPFAPPKPREWYCNCYPMCA